MASTTISAPFTDVGQLREFMATKLYSRDLNESFAAAFAFYKVASMEELMALPAKTNSGKASTMGACWFGLFPFVDMKNPHVELDDVFVGG